MDNSFFTNYLERLENLNRNIHSQMQGLPPAAMDWSPGAEMNSPAVILAHTTGALRYWIGDIALGEPSNRVRDSEFQTRNLTASQLLDRLDAVIAYARASLPRLTLADLEKERYSAQEDERVTCGWALLHALEHGNLHLGHLELTRQLWMMRSGNSK
jgi:uncharacterized damage-inducible protein DinB